VGARIAPSSSKGYHHFAAHNGSEVEKRAGIYQIAQSMALTA
jgi:hypothetical protein